MQAVLVRSGAMAAAGMSCLIILTGRKCSQKVSSPLLISSLDGSRPGYCTGFFLQGNGYLGVKLLMIPCVRFVVMR